MSSSPGSAPPCPPSGPPLEPWQAADGSAPQPGPRSEDDAAVSRARVWTVPNALTALRMALSPAIGYMVLSGDLAPAVYVLALAGALDWADGAVARRFRGQASMLGSFLDPLADKLLIACAGLSLTAVGVLPPALISLFVARDVALVGGAVAYRAAARRVPGESFFSLAHVAGGVEPTGLSKVNTALQIGLVVCALAHAAWPGAALPLPPDGAVGLLSSTLEWALPPLPPAVPWAGLPSLTGLLLDAGPGVASATAAGAIASCATAAPAGASGVLPLGTIAHALSWAAAGTTIASGLDYLVQRGLRWLRAPST